MRRLFFALWPDAATRGEMANRLHSIPRRLGNPVAVKNLHITLAFLGNIEEDKYHCVHSRAKEIKAQSFTMTLSQLGFFPRPRVIWLGPSSCPAPLRDLMRNLNSNLAQCGYLPERRPFHAHLTLFRKALPASLDVDVEPIQWPIEGFCLVESKTRSSGVEYSLLHHYPLVS